MKNIKKPTRKEYIEKQKSLLKEWGKRDEYYFAPGTVLSYIGKYNKEGLTFNEIAYIFNGCKIASKGLNEFLQLYNFPKMIPSLNCHDQIMWSEESYDRFDDLMIEYNFFQKERNRERPYSTEF